MKEFYDMIRSQYGGVHECCQVLGITRDQFDRQLRSGSQVFLNAIADNSRLSRQEVAWEYKYAKG